MRKYCFPASLQNAPPLFCVPRPKKCARGLECAVRVGTCAIQDKYLVRAGGEVLLCLLGSLSVKHRLVHFPLDFYGVKLRFSMKNCGRKLHFSMDFAPPQIHFSMRWAGVAGFPGRGFYPKMRLRSLRAKAKKTERRVWQRRAVLAHAGRERHGVRGRRNGLCRGEKGALRGRRGVRPPRRKCSCGFPRVREMRTGKGGRFTRGDIAPSAGL